MKKCIPSSPSTSAVVSSTGIAEPSRCISRFSSGAGWLPAITPSCRLTEIATVVGVGQVERAAPDELVRLAAQQLAERGVDADPAQVRARDRHPDRRLLEAALEAAALVQLAQLAEGQRAAHERDRQRGERQQLRRPR